MLADWYGLLLFLFKFDSPGIDLLLVQSSAQKLGRQDVLSFGDYPLGVDLQQLIVGHA